MSSPSPFSFRPSALTPGGFAGAEILNKVVADGKRGRRARECDADESMSVTTDKGVGVTRTGRGVGSARTSRFARRLLTEWRRRGWPARGERVVVAVSGGADST